MSVAPLSALGVSLGGMQACLRQMNDAATKIARAGGPLSAPTIGADPNAAAPAADDLDVAGAMMTIEAAQRLFAANAAVVRAADRMAQDAIGLLGGPRR